MKILKCKQMRFFICYLISFVLTDSGFILLRRNQFDNLHHQNLRHQNHRK